MGNWDAGLEGVVALPGGRRVRGRALRAGFPEDDAAPEFGLYLTAKPHEEDRWESRWVRWPDFGLPRSSSDAINAVGDAFERSVHTRVEIGCGGGRGRTGTAIAILARYAGVPADEAVAWVRKNYRPGAVETVWQRRFARHVDIAR